MTPTTKYRPVPIWGILAVAFLTVCGLVACGAEIPNATGSPTPATGQTNNMTPYDIDGQPEPTGEAMLPCPDSHLLAQLQSQQGNLPVIITLAIAYQPEAELDERQIADQRQRIAEAQDAIVASLADTGAEIGRRYQFVPQLALTVDERALCGLLDSPLILHVQADTEDAPTT